MMLRCDVATRGLIFTPMLLHAARQAPRHYARLLLRVTLLRRAPCCCVDFDAAAPLSIRDAAALRCYRRVIKVTRERHAGGIPQLTRWRWRRLPL